METSHETDKTEKLLTALVILALLCFFVIFAILNFKGFADLCTADMYEDTLVARMMAEQRTLFPVDYVFGNQYYVVATPVVSALFYAVTGSQNTSMALATTLMSAFILLSLVWMLRPFVRNTLTLLCAMLALVGGVAAPMLPMMEQGQLLFTQASFYACYLITTFVVFGDYVRAEKEGGLRAAPLLLSLLLCFGTGMQSMRQTCVTILPVLCFELLQALRRKHSLGAFWPAGHRGRLFRALGYAAANMAGSCFVKLLKVPRHTIYSGRSILDGARVSEKLQGLQDAYMDISGLRWVGEKYPLFFTLIFGFFSCVLIFAVIIAFRDLDKDDDCVAKYWWLTIISLAGVAAASFVTKISLRSIYLFMYYPLLAFSLVLVMGRLKGKLRRAFVSLLCLLTLLNAYYSYHESVELSLDETPSAEELACRFIMERGSELVYGANAHPATSVAVYSDGALIAGNWDDEIIFKVVPYINIQSIYTMDDYARATFVFQPWEVEGAMNEAIIGGGEFTVLATFGDLTLCSCTKQMMYPISGFPAQQRLYDEVLN